jgi:hypothetical protein
MIAASTVILWAGLNSLLSVAIEYCASSTVLFAASNELACYEQSGTNAQDTHDPVLFFDRLHQTFELLNRIALPAYRDHFRDDPEKLAVIGYYAGRLATDRNLRHELPDASTLDASTEPDAARAKLMRAALAELRAGRAVDAEVHLKELGVEPHIELQRVDASMPANTARCPLYDADLLYAHRELWRLKTGRPAPDQPASGAQSIAEQHDAIRAARQQAGDSELSLRKFLDKHRRLIWGLAWSYRCRGIELGADADASRVCFLRAWTIGDALFPASDRGRIDRFDPVFLAELGDIYARLGRFDLMLRYIYCDDGLPARYEMARPVAELARVAEAIRLTRVDGTDDLPLEKQMPETVAQILFERPVAVQPSPIASRVARPGSAKNAHIGWILLASGACLIGGAVVWRFVRVARRA